MSVNNKGGVTPVKVSVVTVCYNAKDTILGTIDSVVGQTYSNIEYVVVDGGSSDGTDNIIRSYKGAIDFFISEPDTGVYNAMNKGLCACTGDWVIFMNAGDSFASMDVVARAMILGSNAGVVVGAARLMPQGLINIPRHKYGLILRNNICHQCEFVRRDIIGFFDEGYGLLADYKKNLELLYCGARFKFDKYVYSNYDTGGISGKDNCKEELRVRRSISFLLWLIGWTKCAVKKICSRRFA